MRDDTRTAHDRVDAGYRSCDITAAEGLGLFLADHLRAFSALSVAAGPGQAPAAALQGEYCRALAADLAALGLPVPMPMPMPMPAPAARLSVAPEAALYILLGSRRGAQMMRRHWDAHARGRARLAGAFLSLDPRNAEWRDLCEALAARPAHGPGADRIVADANAIFTLFAPGRTAPREPLDA